MKIALILTGHFREYTEVFDNFDHFILQKLQPDVYIHTWSNLGMTTSKWHFDAEQPLDVTDVLRRYQPKKMTIEDPKTTEVYTDYVGVGVPVSNIVNMFRKMYLGYEMLGSSSYDFVLRGRPDIMFESYIPVREFMDNALYVPDVSNLQVNDHLCFGRSSYVKSYCELYTHIDEYYRPHYTVPNRNRDGSPLHAESLLYHHLLNRVFHNESVIKETKLKYHIPHKRRGL